jgi:type III restriction enzyme
MKFKFDANQQYQLDAVQAVVDLFKGQPQNRGSFEISFSDQIGDLALRQEELGLGNHLQVPDEELETNLDVVRRRNNIFMQESIRSKGMNFSVEMETGTGKTYVYLRSMFELNKAYGLSKFIIVVPSVAIREGVLQSIQDMKEHFRELYSNVPFNHFVYDSKNGLSKLREFAVANTLQIMVINIDSFNKKANNIIHSIQEKKTGGRKPIEFIRSTNPIVIMDEPQNMESDKARDAIASLKPLCTLRYSATHRDKYNLVYQLNPVQAFQKRLVKRISVNSILADGDATQAYIRVEEIKRTSTKITAKLAYFEDSKDGPKLKKRQFKQDDDLFMKSKEREEYRNGFRITEINARPTMEFIKFSNGIKLRLGEEQGGTRTDVVKKQIRETIVAHFQKEEQVQGMGLKVLSLFFLDRVDNYRIHTDDGYELGQYAEWFEEMYAEVAKEYRTTLFPNGIPDVGAVHDGYFSKDKKGVMKDTSGSTAADDDTYTLIMRNKKRLLDLDNPLKFIFSHSALREGWDNPNVFQICTLNESVSTLKKRQEIGRGLRLPVNQNGERVFDEYVNNLVVVVNESYQDFVSTLQTEFEEDCGVVFGRLPTECFAGILIEVDGEEHALSRQESETIWEHLKSKGWIADDGFILDTFGKSVESHTFAVPEVFQSGTLDIIKTIEQHQIKSHIDDYNKKVRVKVNEQVMLDPEFESFWNTVNTRTIYNVTYDTEDLISRAAKAISEMESIVPLRLRSNLVDIDIKDSGVDAQMVRTPQMEARANATRLPDVLSYIQSKVELTRSTISLILKRSGRLMEFPVNPQSFMDACVKQIRDVLHRLVIEGIQYERLDQVSYEMSKFREDEHKLEFANDRVVPTSKSVYDYILYDSGVEKKFAEDLNSMKDVKYFIKLPAWFKVPTPIGTYNPDWAILKENGRIVYMIRETKSTKDKLKLRIPETDKIKCGEKHFLALGVDYAVEDGSLESLTSVN